MATINLSKLNDIIIPTNNGDTYRGNEGDDTYILVSQESSSSVSIIDTKGSNTIQLPEWSKVKSILNLKNSSAKRGISNLLELKPARSQF